MTRVALQVEQLEGVRRLVDAPARDDDELGAEVIAEPPHGFPDGGPRRGPSTRRPASPGTEPSTTTPAMPASRASATNRPQAESSSSGDTQMKRIVRRPELPDGLYHGLQVRAIRRIVPAGRGRDARRVEHEMSI